MTEKEFDIGDSEENFERSCGNCQLYIRHFYENTITAFAKYFWVLEIGWRKHAVKYSID